MRPPPANPLVGALVEASGEPVLPKQAWTPVADFAAFGIEAVNLGPGDPALAHRTDEYVEIEALARCHGVLESLPVRLNPAVEATPGYPFLRIAELRERARARRSRR